MKFKPVPHGVDIVGPSIGRAPGLHASDLYGAYYRDTEPKRYDKRGKNNERLEARPENLAMGLAWERYLEERLVASGIDAHRPEEQHAEEDGVELSYNPDLFIFEDDGLRGGEIKLTFMSETDAFDDPKFNKWHSQMMIYGHLLEIPKWRLYGLFAAGDYKKQRDPVLRAFDVEYTAREMREEWQTMVRHGRHKGLIV